MMIMVVMIIMIIRVIVMIYHYARGALLRGREGLLQDGEDGILFARRGFFLWLFCVVYVFC